MREIVHLQAGQCGNQIGAKVYLHLTKKHTFCNILTFGFLPQNSSGKSYLMNTELTQLVPTMETLTSNWRESMSTTTKQLVENTFPVLF